MSRLPIPGSDDGTWGGILNDYLSQAHNVDGSLKTAGIVSAGSEVISNKGVSSGYMGLDVSGRGAQPPKFHAATHSVGGTDALITGTPLTIGTTNVSGSGPGYALSDHVHAERLIVTASQQSGSAYSLVLGDAGTVIEFTSGSGITLTIPTNASVAFPIGTIIEVFQYGAGQVTVAGAGGVTLRSDGGKVKTAAQYATIGLRQRAVDEWILNGDLA